MNFDELTEFSLRYVTNVHLRRSIPAGVLAYAVGYLATYVAVASRVESLLRGITVELRYGGGYEPLVALIEPTPEPWKAVGWFFHAAHHSELVVPRLATRNVLNIDLVARVGGPYRALYVVPPVALVVAGYVVARYGTTTGPRGEDYAGASVVFGYLPCAVAGGLLYTVGRPSVGPDLFSTFFVVGGVYPLVFGWLGGRAARMWVGVSQPVGPSDSNQ